MNYETYEVRVYDNGNKYWFQNGEYHRTDGPAVEWSNVEYAVGYKAWFQNGKYHRTDGPAIERTDGYKAWYQNGKYHRLDGPAIEYADGDKEYYIDGVKYFYEEWKQKVNEINNPVKELTVSEISKLLGYEVKIIKE